MNNRGQETRWQDAVVLAAQSVISVDGATSVRADIVPGESHFYKVNADYRQNVVGELSPGGYDEEAECGPGRDSVDLNMFNCARQEAQADSDSDGTNWTMLGIVGTVGTVGIGVLAASRKNNAA